MLHKFIEELKSKLCGRVVNGNLVNIITEAEINEVAAKVLDRKKSNTQILEQLAILVEKYPDLRFRQILSTLNLDNDGFYEESYTTLQKIQTILEDLK